MEFLILGDTNKLGVRRNGRRQQREWTVLSDEASSANGKTRPDRAVSGGLSEKVKLKPKPAGGGGDSGERRVKFSTGVFSQGQVQRCRSFLPHDLGAAGI